MPHKHPHLVGRIRVDVVSMGLAQAVGEEQIILAAVSLATDPADAVHDPWRREFRDGQVLGPFAIEFEQVDFVDPDVGQDLPEVFGGESVDLQPEIEITRDFEEAKRDNDHARVAELEKQKETFSAEIEKATGLGGRKREQSDSERVRKNVSNAVTRAIEAVALEHERLGKHLGNSINSGSTFSYDPERDPQWLV
jgi:hypothetical protein